MALPETERFAADPPQRAPVVGARPSRRTIMNSLVALPIAGALPVSSPAISVSLSSEDPINYAAILARFEQVVEDLRTRYVSDDFRLDEAAAARALLYFRHMAEGGPDDDAKWQDALDFMIAHGQSFDWILCGSPTALICKGAALAVVEQRQKQAQSDDATLLEMEKEIFQLREKIHAFDPETARLQNIWSDEMIRLHQASLTGDCKLSKEERSAAVAAMPEAIEHSRLVAEQRPFREQSDELVEQMWSTQARTPEGRRAKLLVLLGHIMVDDWRADNREVDWEIKMARDLMIEFVGGEAAAQLRDQFAA